MSTQTTVVPAIAVQINAAFDRAFELGAEVKERTKETIQCAMLCGRLLAQAKADVGHGSWYAWLEANCPRIKREWARQLMELSKRNYSGDLDFKSLRQALLFFGIIAEPKQLEAPKREKGQENYLHYVQSTVLYFRRFDPLKVEKQERQAIAERLKPIAELYERLQKSLTKEDE